MNILIIEDDLFLWDKIKSIFERRTISNIIKVKSSYEDFVDEIPLILSYDIVLVDIVLTKVTEKNGLDIIELIRSKSKTIPIIVMSWFDEISWLEKCFDLWASDYIIKPFRLKELEVRILKWFKLFIYSDVWDNYTISYWNLSFDLKENQFYFKDKVIPLTKSRKYILYLFISNSEKLLTESFFVEKIWWDRWLIIDRNLRVNVFRLKKVLEEYWIDEWIINFRWEWYMLKK